MHFFSAFLAYKKSSFAQQRFPLLYFFQLLCRSIFYFFELNPNETDSSLGLLDDPSCVRLLLPPAPPAEHQLLEPRHLPPQGAHHDAGGVRLLRQLQVGRGGGGRRKQRDHAGDNSEPNGFN